MIERNQNRFETEEKNPSDGPLEALFIRIGPPSIRLTGTIPSHISGQLWINPAEHEYLTPQYVTATLGLH